MQKFENGGDGTDGEELVTPDNSKEGSTNSSSVEATPEATEPKKVAPISPEGAEEQTPDIPSAKSTGEQQGLM